MATMTTRPETETNNGYEATYTCGVTAAELAAANIPLDSPLDDDIGWDLLRLTCTVGFPSGEDVSRRYYGVQALSVSLRDALSGREPAWQDCGRRDRSLDVPGVERLWTQISSAAQRAAVDTCEADLDAMAAEAAATSPAEHEATA